MPPPDAGFFEAAPVANEPHTVPQQRSPTKMRSCPRWDKCNAPICPLDALWERRAMQSSDPVCFYLIEAAKPGAEPLFQRRGWGDLYRTMVALAPSLSARWGRIARALQRAPFSGSRLARLPPSERPYDRSV